MAKTQTRKSRQQQQVGEETTEKTKNMKKGLNRGVWTAEEDTKLDQVIQIYGPRKWTSLAAKAGLDRCGKSCRLRWMNYLRPNIKRGNISDQEEDLILRLHKLLGNRWSLIAGRLPGRTDNEIKNYWNSHLSKKLSIEGKQTRSSELARKSEVINRSREEEQRTEMEFNVDDFFDFSNENPQNLEWVNRFLELNHKT